MKLVINDTVEMPFIIRADEIVDNTMPNRVTFLSAYSQTIFDNLNEFFASDYTIIDLKLYEDDRLLNLYPKYKTLYVLLHHQGIAGENIELSIKE